MNYVVMNTTANASAMSPAAGMRSRSRLTAISFRRQHGTRSPRWVRSRPRTQRGFHVPLGRCHIVAVPRPAERAAEHRKGCCRRHCGKADSEDAPVGHGAWPRCGRSRCQTGRRADGRRTSRCRPGARHGISRRAARRRVPAAEPNAIDVGVAGDIAAEHAPGPGSLQMLLLDALHTLDEATVRRRARIAEVP